MAGFRAAPVVCVCDGQSHNVVPSAPDSYPVRMCADLGFVSPIVPAVAGAPWLLLGTAERMARKVTPYAHAGLATFYIMEGGQGDLDSLFGAATGATTYARMVAMADTAAGAGYTYLIGCTVPPSTSLTSGEETERLAYNALIIANGDDTFDSIVDLANTPGLDDNLDTDYYSDGIHWTNLGAQLAADTIGPAVTALI